VGGTCFKQLGPSSVFGLFRRGQTVPGGRSLRQTNRAAASGAVLAGALGPVGLVLVPRVPSDLPGNVTRSQTGCLTRSGTPRLARALGRELRYPGGVLIEGPVRGCSVGSIAAPEREGQTKRGGRMAVC